MRTISLAGSNESRTYGPEPADSPSRNVVAESASAASGPSVAPFSWATSALTMPVAGIARIVGTLGFGVSVLTTTTPSSGDEALKPWTVTEGLPLRLTSRLRLKTTSSAVSSEPSENVTPSRRVNVNSVASALDSQLSASRGLGSDTSDPSKVTSVSYIACTAMAPVASYTCAGSRLLTTKEFATVRVPPVVGPSSPEDAPPLPPEPPADPAVHPASVRAAAAASARLARRRGVCRCMLLRPCRWSATLRAGALWGGGVRRRVRQMTPHGSGVCTVSSNVFTMMKHN